MRTALALLGLLGVALSIQYGTHVAELHATVGPNRNGEPSIPERLVILDS